MTDEAKEARRAYKREWARKNRDKVKRYQAAYWERRSKKGDVEHEHREADASADLQRSE